MPALHIIHPTAGIEPHIQVRAHLQTTQLYAQGLPHVAAWRKRMLAHPKLSAYMRTPEIHAGFLRTYVKPGSATAGPDYNYGL